MVWRSRKIKSKSPDNWQRLGYKVGGSNSVECYKSWSFRGDRIQ